MPKTATAPIIGLLVTMLAIVALMLLIRSGPDASGDMAVDVSASDGSAAAAPPLTEPIIDLAADAAPSAVPATAALEPTPPPTTAPVLAPTQVPQPTLAPAVLPTATVVPPTASSTNEQRVEIAGNAQQSDAAQHQGAAASAGTQLADPAPTLAPVVAATALPTATATLVPAPTATAIPAPTSTPLPLPTATSTAVPPPTATPVPAPTSTSTPIPPTPEPVQSLAQLEAWMLNEVNQVRANAGLSPLAPSSALASIGRDWSQNMANAGGISHRPSNQLSAMMPAGWTGWAENVAQAPYGSRIGTVEDAVRWAQNALEQSPGHYTNMVGNYNTLGIGLHVQGDYVWVTQNFGQY